MKSQNFIKGLLTGAAIVVLVFLLVSNKPVPEPVAMQNYKITSLRSGTDVYKLNVDNVQYLVVISSNGGTAITRHR